MTLLRIDQIDHTAIQARAEVNHFAVREYADARKFDEVTIPQWMLKRGQGGRQA